VHGYLDPFIFVLWPTIRYCVGTSTVKHKSIGLCKADIVMSSSEGMHLSKGSRWRGERGNREGEVGSVSCQPGTRVDGNSRHGTKEGFPSK
jgi:hypothetical protein